MKTKLFLFFLLSYTCIYSQEKQHLHTQTKALDVGIYDYGKVKHNSLKILYGEEATKAVEKRIAGNQDLIDLVGGYLLEQDIISYYPEEDVALFEDPATTVSVFDLKNIKEGYGDTNTYIYSPSARYRFSTLDADGPHYYLEEKINDKYQICENVDVYGVQDSFYWYDDETIYYLGERSKYTEEGDEIKYWVGYSTKLSLIKE